MHCQCRFISVAATLRTNACLAAEILMAGLAGLADLSHRGADAGAVERWCSQRRVEHGAQVAGVPGEACVFAEIAECRSEEHTSELQSLMRNSYAVFCLKKKKHNTNKDEPKTTI